MTKTGAVLLLFCCSFFYFYFLPHFSSKWSGRMRYIICQNGCIDDCFFSNWSEVQISTKNPKDEKNWNSSFFLLHYFSAFFSFPLFFFPFSFLCPNLLFCYKTSFLYFFFSSLPFSLFYATRVDLYCFLVLLELSLSSSLSFVDRCETASGWWNGRWWTLKWALCSCKLRRALLTVHRCYIQSGRSS